nr:hypothetical protein [Tanacetum cinerariifolium]
MNDPDITMEECIQLTADKGRRHDRFPTIVYNDASTSNQNVSSEPTDLFSYKLVHVDDLKPEPVNNHVEINIESCSENTDIKPMDNVICIRNDTTPIEFDKNIEINHDTAGIITAYPGVWIRRIGFRYSI